jgi:hypothetical protein
VNFLIENLVLGLLVFCDTEFVTEYFFSKILYAKWRKFATKKSLLPTWQPKKFEFVTWLPKNTGTKLKAESKFGEFLSQKIISKFGNFFLKEKHQNPINTHCNLDCLLMILLITRGYISY